MCIYKLFNIEHQSFSFMPSDIDHIYYKTKQNIARSITLISESRVGLSYVFKRLHRYMYKLK